MHRYRHFLVALGRTEADAALLKYAALVAGWGTATEVHFVHVLPSDGDPARVPSSDRVREELQAAVERDFRPAPANLRQSFAVLTGTPIDQLLIYAAEHGIDLLFVGGSSSGRQALARRLAMKAPCSVWLVPEQAQARVERVLVPIDFSEPAADSLRVATSLARLSGEAECLALHVFFNEARVTYEDYERVLRGQEEQAFSRFVQPIDTKGVAVAPLFVEGVHVGRIIHETAQQQEADLIVMATRGRSRSAAILLGSVTEETILETSVALLVVKHFGARMSVLQALFDRRFLGRPGPQTD
jgi:nucleotide-binding universal stress UspA family protein